jgi:predicted nucleotide-binding protein
VKIFISYAREDTDFAKYVNKYLRDKGHDVLIDVNSIRAGDAWAHSIEKNISDCDIFVVILTPDSIISLNVEKEVLQAQKQNKIIVPCINEDVDYGKIKWDLDKIQGIEFSDEFKLARKLSSKIKNYENYIPSDKGTNENYESTYKTIEATNTAVISPTQEVQFTVEEGNIAHYMSDVIALKYAQGFYGADLYISSKLGQSLIAQVEALLPGDHLLIDSKGDILSKKILFVGVSPSKDFDYEQIRKFSYLVLKVLENDNTVRDLAMTIHGIGFGLDETESTYALLGGILDAFREGHFPKQLKRISIVDKNEDRVIRLRKAVDKILANSDFAFKSKEKWAYNINPNYWSKKIQWPWRATKPVESKDSDTVGIKEIDTAGIQTRNKPVIFVAMPFKKEMNNLFYFGIQQPASEENFLCERTDQDSMIYTSDILTQVKKRIESSSLVIAVLTDSNPNVYLEVGYAWGKNKQILFLIRKGEQPKFDLQGFRYFEYEDNDIKPIRDTLIKQMNGLKSSGLNT